MSASAHGCGSEIGRVVRLGRSCMSTADRHPLQFLRQLVAQASAYRSQSRRLRGDDRAHARIAIAELDAWIAELRAASVPAVALKLLERPAIAPRCELEPLPRMPA